MKLKNKTGGKIKIVRVGSNSSPPMLMLFNIKKLKQIIADNFEFYHYHFPNCRNKDEIAEALLHRTEKSGIQGSLMGVTLGFPRGDALLWGSMSGEKIPQKTLLSFLKGDEWTKHREVINAGKNPDGTWKIPGVGGNGFMTWNNNSQSASDLSNALNETQNNPKDILTLLKQISK